MPQFDNSILLPEMFWLFVCFSFLFIYFSIFTKYTILRSNFFRKYWLNSFLKFSKVLQNNIVMFSKCYSENVYLKNLEDSGIFLKFSSDSKNLQIESLGYKKNSELRKSYHSTIAKFLK